jgi:hypothetical protein
MATIKNDIRPTNNPAQRLLLINNETSTRPTDQSLEDKALDGDIPNFINELTSCDNQVTLYDDNADNDHLRNNNINLLKSLPPLNLDIYNRLISLQEDVIKVTINIIKRSNAGL